MGFSWYVEGVFVASRHREKALYPAGSAQHQDEAGRDTALSKGKIAGF